MYELSRNRFKELKHFCLQYKEMKADILFLEKTLKTASHDPTGEVASRLSDLKYAVNLIETTAFNIGKFPGEKILEIVSEDKSIGEVCPDEHDICEWYLRKFYWMLSVAKGV